MHELFHIFNQMNEAFNPSADRMLDEGIAIFIFKTYFPENRTENEKTLGMIEPIFGTRSYYKDVMKNDSGDFVGFNLNTVTPLAQQVYSNLMQRDPAKLPIADKTKLNSCYNKYFKDINRNQDFNIFLNLFLNAFNKMNTENPGYNCQ